MPIDWTEVDIPLDRARRKTDDELAAKVSSLTRLKDDEVKALFPKQGDVERLKRLMTIVQSSASDQQRVNRLAAEIEDLGGVVLKLLGRLV
ncbi:hypothetical protein [Anaeromyxobacter sp. Fw109-5]|uniref:hypothetical protein n=1 Tax=Anaeromyxobacter sp. (strain Fw109-5) TaxID=404589 RepID=UPI0000ED6E69|nr:hypothetical protein [Anaeromyxobacter sp. Fw109-5]ABS28183.1 hypothetical protein Anae109_4005 [Anaeromyxobacter sp. Fw109-5]